MGLIRDTLVDLKNGLPPRSLADRLYPRGIVFVHVPKCAGTSVEKALRAQYRLSRISIDPETSFKAAEKMLGQTAGPKTRHDILIRASELRRDMLHYYLSCGYKCITGHAPLSVAMLDTAEATHDFATVLRDPVERYLSHLRFNLSERSGHGQLDMNVKDFLETRRAKVMGSLYGKYFSGLPMQADFSAPEAIDAAKAALEKFAAVGFVEDLSEFANDLTCQTGKSIRIGYENKTDTVDGIPFSETVIDQVTQLCTTDIAIYQWAKSKFFPIDA